MQVILHAGFHKTGTSSLQACLAANRALLAPICRIVLEDELAEALRHSTRFATRQNPIDLAAFTADFAGLCEQLSRAAPPALIISSEGLSGRTPGKLGVMDYASAVPLARAMHDAVRAVFGRKAQQRFVYTTRAADAWLSSAWRHNLAGYRVTADLAEFRATYAKAADFEVITQKIARLLHKTEVMSLALEDLQGLPLGPADAVLRLLDLPEAVVQQMRVPSPRNRGIGAEAAAALLALNRSDLTDADLRQRKLAIRKTPSAS